MFIKTFCERLGRLTGFAEGWLHDAKQLNLSRKTLVLKGWTEMLASSLPQKHVHATTRCRQIREAQELLLPLS